MLRSIAKVLLAVCLSALPTVANTATIAHEKLDATREIISIEGNIVSGDLEQFRQISLRHPKAIVVLNSDGGLIYPAIEIGKIIKVMGYATVVSDDNVCASACALIWMAGSKRLLSASGHIGFHASYRESNGKVVESGVANALVGNYLTLLGASAKTIVFATTAPPDRVQWLTTANREAAGIDFELIPPPIQILSAPAAPAPASDDDYEYFPPAAQTWEAPQAAAPPNWQWSNSPAAPWVLIGLYADGTELYINQESFERVKIDSNTKPKWDWIFHVKLNFTHEHYYMYSNALISCFRKSYRMDGGKLVNNVDNVTMLIESHFPIDGNPIDMGDAGIIYYRAICQ